jgi:regulator of replication initiation timing
LEVQARDDQHQDYEEEIEALIEDELVHLHQENERLQLEQEHMARRRAALEVVYDTFTGTTTRAAHCGSLIGGAKSRSHLA